MRAAVAILGAVGLLACAGAGAGARVTGGGLPMATDAAFENVQWGSREPSACTPEVEGDFEGIRIAAPRVVVFEPGQRDTRGGFARVIVCAIYRLRASSLRALGALPGDGTVVAVNAETHATVAAEMRYERPPRQQPAGSVPASGPDDADDGTVQEGYFAVNPLHFLDLAEAPGTWQLHVTFGTYTSNVVTVTLKTREQAAREAQGRESP